MRKWLFIILGMAMGSLLTLAFRIPLLPPLNDNAATVLASLASTALAVAGAFWLWGHQADQRGKDIKATAVPVFQKFYITVLQVRAFVDLTSTKSVYKAIREHSPQGTNEELTPKELVEHRERQFFAALDGAIREANIAAQHWDGIQDAILSIRPPALDNLLTLYRYTRHAMVELPALAERAKGTGPSRPPPVLDRLDRQRLDDAISTLAKHLNALDGGTRDESGAEQVSSAEGPYEAYLMASKPLGPEAPPEDAEMLAAARHGPHRSRHSS